MYCTCKCSSLTVAFYRHLAFHLSLIVGHELSLPSLRRTVLLLTRSRVRFGRCSSLTSLRIPKTVTNTSAQHAVYGILFKYIL